MHKKSYIILSLLKNARKESSQLLSDFLESGYQSRARTIDHMWKNNELPYYTNKKYKTKKENKRYIIKNYYSCIKRLENNGLISKHKENRKKYIEITARGLETLKNTKTSRVLADKYPKELSNYYILIVFDIPELTRQKRDWLRGMLKQLKFRMIQKSVWMGKTLIPVDFVSDLRNMDILRYVNFFEVIKKYQPAKIKK